MTKINSEEWLLLRYKGGKIRSGAMLLNNDEALEEFLPELKYWVIIGTADNGFKDIMTLDEFNLKFPDGNSRFSHNLHEINE